MFELLGAFIYRRRRQTLIASALFLVLAIAVLVRGGPLTSGGMEGLESARAQDAVDTVLGRPSAQTFAVVFQPKDPASTTFDQDVEAAVAPLRDDPHVAQVASPGAAPAYLAQILHSPNDHASLALVTMSGDLKTAIANYSVVNEKLIAAAAPKLKMAATGHVPFTHDLGVTMEHDLLHAELISVPIALLILLFVFRTLVASVLPIGVGGLAVMGGVAIVVGLSHYTDIAQYTLNITSLIGLGVAIDYSLFTVSRYREELAQGHDYPEALARAVGTAGKVVAFSGVAVGTGLGGLFFFKGSYLYAMGIGGSVVVLLSVIFSLTFLPALLAVLGPKIHAGKFPLVNLTPKEGFWHAMALAVMKRPLVFLVPTLAVLLIMGTPFLHLRFLSADVRVLEPGIEARDGYELLKKNFPDLAATRVEVAVTFPTAPALDAARVAALADLAKDAMALPGVSRVQSLTDPDPAMHVYGDPPPSTPELATLLVNPPRQKALMVQMIKGAFVKDRVVLMHVLTDATPESDTARNIVRGLRARRAVGDGYLEVGGQSAQDMDGTEFIVIRAPRAIAAVVIVTFLVLFFLLRSVVLPIKAVLMNFVSIAGAFGAMVYIFQDGHLFIHTPRPLEPALPVLLFCVVFGLSMDYEVLMLSRMKEVYERTGDNVHAVAEGLEKTAGLITSAAAIMVSVFAAFALAHVVLIQAVGCGMAFAVALDATLVRVFLVPSTMRLFGDWNWWAPRFLGGHGSKHPPYDLP